MKTSRGVGAAGWATRAGTAGWRDPRLWIGVAIVAVSVVAGVRVVGGADDSVSVWAVTEDLAPGAVLDPDLLESRAVRFTDEEDAGRYLLTGAALPTGGFVTRGVGAGELLPLAAVGSAEQSGVVQVPIQVPSDGVPPAVTIGSRVDIYMSDVTEARRPALLLLGDVTVSDAPGSADGFGVSEERQLVLGVPDDEEAQLTSLIAASAAGTLTVVVRG